MKKLLLIFLCSGLLVSCNQPTENSATKPNEAQTNAMATTQGDLWLGSLITNTPQEGRELAILMARKTIGAMQSDPEVKKKLRAEYAEDPQLLILSSQVVATEFQTVAEANNYWRK